jgi:hypothetical protein
MDGAAILTNPTEGWACRVAERVLPGSAVITFGDDYVGLEGRFAGLELRDTFAILAPGPSVCFAFFFRKPLTHPTVAEQILTTDTGALHIGACRVRLGSNENADELAARSGGSRGFRKDGFVGGTVDGGLPPGWDNSKGRWPPNLLLVHGVLCRNLGTSWECGRGCPVQFLDQQSGELQSGLMVAGQQRVQTKGGGGYHGDFPDEATGHDTYGDSGGASRFFPQFASADSLLDWFKSLILPPGLSLCEDA